MQIEFVADSFISSVIKNSFLLTGLCTVQFQNS